ncbi:MAG: AraC family transcriptional regulator [Treponema sp.]|jgi:AraC-like DNA-binding protein/mannose-6-phosphate isomerase-like protein (cupin superfamily)|nr:AraC family transcriptional regulator [Treponema sp.]
MDKFLIVMGKKPWQEKEEFGFSLPFRCWDSTLTEFVYPAHWHEYYEVFIVHTGKVSIVIEGNAHDACQGDIVFIDPGQVHSFPSSDQGTILRLFHFEQRIFLKEDHIHGIVGDGTMFAQQPIIRAVPRSGPDALGEVLYTRFYGILTELFTEYKEKKTGYRLAIKAGVYLLVLTYMRNRLAESPDALSKKSIALTEDRRLERVYLLIYRDFHRADLDLDQAAREAALSRFHFARFFKKQTGRSFWAFLSSVRLGHARDLLVKTDLPVTLIAQECGFASMPTFYRVFKTGTGSTPINYRKSNN